MPACCAVRGVRIIRVGKVQVGLTGLGRVFESLCSEGRSPDDEGAMDQALLRLQAAGNYIAPGTEK
jgi:hypothetical protein